MPARKAKAVWIGTIKDGKGTVEVGSGLIKEAYSFSSRFEDSLSSSSFPFRKTAACSTASLSSGGQAILYTVPSIVTLVTFAMVYF